MLSISLSHVFTAAPKFLRVYNVKSFSAFFSDYIRWNLKISFPCARINSNSVFVSHKCLILHCVCVALELYLYHQTLCTQLLLWWIWLPHRTPLESYKPLVFSFFIFLNIFWSLDFIKLTPHYNLTSLCDLFLLLIS